MLKEIYLHFYLYQIRLLFYNLPHVENFYCFEFILIILCVFSCVYILVIVSLLITYIFIGLGFLV